MQYIEKELDTTIAITFPPIDTSSIFERRMFIAKYFQVRGNKIETLSDILWIDQRTIESDIKALRGEYEEEAYSICGKVFRIDETERNKGTITMPSTVHPLFLTPNLTQIFITLKGLKQLSENTIYTNYAKQMASDIWDQLSDYAKQRILYICNDLIIDDKEWYQSLENTVNVIFIPRKCAIVT